MKLMLALTVMVSGLDLAQASASQQGGTAVVCRDQSGKIASAEMFDLVEGRLNGLTIQESSVPVDLQVREAIKKLSLASIDRNSKRATQIYEDILHLSKPVPAGFQLSIPQESNTRLLPQGCALEAVGVDQDEGGANQPKGGCCHS